MELERYNQSFEEQVDQLEEEADRNLRSFRQRCLRNFIDNFNKQQREWDLEFRDLLTRSQSEPNPKISTGEPTSGIFLHVSPFLEEVKDIEPIHSEIEIKNANPSFEEIKNVVPIPTKERVEYVEPFPEELRDYFTNNILIRDYLETQRQLESDRQQFASINSDPSLKQFKTDISLFIRTQINSISNSDKDHLNSKTKVLCNLFSGEQINYQNRIIQASRHPQGQLYSMDQTAQTFVTVGTRLVNSVPAIAKSMATVINDIIIKNSMQPFRKYILGNLQERCPYLIPMYPRLSDFTCGTEILNGSQEIKYKIACGYNYDSKSQSLESEDKHLARMRSMVLIYASILAQHEDKSLSWTWLVSFLSLKPEPVITATILQAYLQELSKPMSKAFGRQYRKLVSFIKNDYMKMIEEVTSKSEVQALIKLKNQLSEETSIFATPDMSSIFKPIRF